MKLVPSSWFYLLAFVSGAVGLAYEILIIRFISIYFGDVFYVAILVLASVFAGLALGYAYGVRWARYVYIVEWGIAACVLLYALVHVLFGPVELLPLMASLPQALFVITSSVLAMIPMILVGASIPMFETLGKRYGAGFVGIYKWYNLGAALWIIAIELVVLQFVGIGEAVLALSLVNIAIGAVLYRLKLTPVYEKEGDDEHTRTSWCQSSLVLLGVVSLVSSVWYVYALELGMKIFGPGSVTISLTIAASVAAIGIACWLFEKYRADRLYLLLGVFIVALFVLLPVVLDLYAWVVQNWTPIERSWAHMGVVSIFLFTVLVPVFVLFGSTVPVWSRYTKYSSQTILVVVASANALGVLLGYVVLYPYLSGWYAYALVGGVAMILYVFSIRERQISVWGFVLTCLIAAGVALGAIVYPVERIASGSGHYFSQGNPSQSVTRIDEYRAYGNDATVVHKEGGIYSVIHMGYQTLSFSPHQQIGLREGAMASVGSYYHKREGEKQALFIGLGTGASVGAASYIYDAVKVYEINPAMLELAHGFEQDNFDLFTRDNVDIVLNDGFVGVASEEAGSYDAVINVATLPSFFTANKVHSYEFVTLAKRALREDGVYVGWFDRNVKEEGLRVYNDTLHAVFNACDYFLLNMGYYAYVCGDNLEQVDIQQALKGVEHEAVREIIDRMQYLKVDLETEQTGRLNSVNYPRLILWGVLGHTTYLDITDEFSTFVAGRLEAQWRELTQERQKELCASLEWLVISLPTVDVPCSE